MNGSKAWNLLRVLQQQRKNQKGFTLIELLVVISILGILAAIVTMSMVGITSIATQRASKTELQSVQIAYDTMLADQGVSADQACPSSGQQPTQNMAAFPTSIPWIDQSNPSNPADPNLHAAKQLYPRYLRQQTTHGTYHCVPGQNGAIQQDNYTP